MKKTKKLALSKTVIKQLTDANLKAMAGAACGSAATCDQDGSCRCDTIGPCWFSIFANCGGGTWGCGGTWECTWF